MFGLLEAVLLSLTQQGDEVLLLTPTYNRIIKTVKFWGRKWVEYQFKI
jgi:bifunctional pyridoxal-dependent enzyme with beta-cystathionase and maltose regulon repressor activities